MNSNGSSHQLLNHKAYARTPGLKNRHSSRSSNRVACAFVWHARAVPTPTGLELQPLSGVSHGELPITRGVFL